MQNEANTPASPVVNADVQAHADTLAAQATARVQAKRVRKPATVKPVVAAKPTAKRTAAKTDKRTAAKTDKPAKPVKASADARKASADARKAASEAKLSQTREARALAAVAVKHYYTGASLPFKAAADTFSAINVERTAKRATPRQAALLAAMLISGDNVKRDGRFTRGAFVIDGRNVQPESGCLGDMLNRTVSYVSGPLTGANQRDAIFRIDLKAALAEITSHLSPSPMRTQAIARLNGFGIKA